MSRRKGQGPGSAPPARPLSGPWLDFPSLVVLVYPTSRGMRLQLNIHHHRKGKRAEIERITDVVWRPPSVSDAAVLRWAEKACRGQLDRLLADARKGEAGQ